MIILFFYLQIRNSDDFSELDFGSEEYRDCLRVGYGVYFQEEIENGSVKCFDDELMGMEYIFKKKLKMEVSNVSMTSLDVEGCYLQSE